MASTAEELKTVVVVGSSPPTEDVKTASATPKSPTSAAGSPRSKLISPFMSSPGMDPRDVPFWPPQRYVSDKVDFGKAPQDWDTPLLLKQIVEHKRPYPLDSPSFREFLVKFYSEENIDFLLELSRLRRKILEDGDARTEELLAFYGTYLKESGAKSANVSSAALSHIQGVLTEGERPLEIRDFNLANRDIADLLIRGPYLKQFFKDNLRNEFDQRPTDIFLGTLYTMFSAGCALLVVYYSYFWSFLLFYCAWAMILLFMKIYIQICPILSLYWGGYRLRPGGKFWHCMYMNDFLQKIHDQDIIDHQNRVSWIQLVFCTATSIGLVIGTCLTRYYVILKNDM